MARLRHAGAVQAFAGTPASSAGDRAAAAASALLADARRGPAYATNVEQHCATLGRQQLTDVVRRLFTAHAETLAAQRQPPAT